MNPRKVKSLKVGIVCSRFNEFVVNALLDGARRMRAFLQRVGVWARVEWFVNDPVHVGARSDEAIIAP